MLAGTAGVAQLVEHKLPMLGVEGSNPFSRSVKGDFRLRLSARLMQKMETAARRCFALLQLLLLGVRNSVGKLGRRPTAPHQ